MTERAAGRRALRKLAELRDVHEFLDEVRIRPGVWARGSSLQHLDSILVGYRIASEIHGIDESFEFWNGGPFSTWLWKRLNMAYPSALAGPSRSNARLRRRAIHRWRCSSLSWMSSARNVVDYRPRRRGTDP
jgi:hypothetical protein